MFLPLRCFWASGILHGPTSWGMRIAARAASGESHHFGQENSKGPVPEGLRARTPTVGTGVASVVRADMKSITPVCHRVLLTTETEGPLWTFTFELVRALRAFEIRVAIAAFGPPIPVADRQELRAMEHVSLHMAERFAEPDDALDERAAGDWLMALEAAVMPDVVHVNLPWHTRLAWMAPVILTAHPQYFPEAGSSRFFAAWRGDTGRAVQAADLVTAASQAIIDRLEDRFGAFRGAEPVAYGRDALAFAPVRKEDLILSVGNLPAFSKDPAYEAAARRVAWPLYVAGRPGSHDPEEYRPLDTRTIPASEPADWAHWASRAALCVSLELDESSTFQELAAALSGCALVLSDTPSHRETWGDAALYVQAPGPLDSLLRVLGALTHDPALVQAQGQRARRRATQFSAARMAAQYMERYEEALRRTIVLKPVPPDEPASSLQKLPSGMLRAV